MKFSHNGVIGNDTSANRSILEERFFRKVQQAINMFVFFLPLGFIKVANISITFFVFLYIVLIFLKKKKKLFRIENMTDLLMAILFFILLISIVFSEETYRTMTVAKEIKLSLRVLYWLLLALFIKTWAYRIDFYQVSRSFFFGTIALIGFYYTINQELEIVTQNSFAFMLVVTTPFSMYYIFKKYSFYMALIAATIIFYFELSSTSRAGAILMFFQLALLFMVVGYIRKKTLLFILLLLSPIMILTMVNYETYKYQIAEIVRPYNPDTADLIENPQRVNEQDKSWLDRKQMIVKALMIFEEHPWLGIGFGHFKYYWVDMPIISPYLNKSMYFYNRLSPHNTYIQILAGAGIFALGLLLIIELRILLRGLRIAKAFRNDPKIFIFVSFLGMIIYFYVIAVAMGAITWFVMGYAMSLLLKRKRS